VDQLRQDNHSTVEPMHFVCVKLVKQHNSTRSTRRARLATLCNLYKVMICKLFTNLLQYTFV